MTCDLSLTRPGPPGREPAAAQGHWGQRAILTPTLAFAPSTKPFQAHRRIMTPTREGDPRTPEVVRRYPWLTAPAAPLPTPLPQHGGR
jgi:hypothetical protein